MGYGVLGDAKLAAKGIGKLAKFGVNYGLPVYYMGKQITDDFANTQDLAQTLFDNKYGIAGNTAAMFLGRTHPWAALTLAGLGTVSDALLKPSRAQAAKAPKQETKQAPKQETKQEAKQETKQEAKQETKKEAKQETKKEAKQETKKEVKQKPKQETKSEAPQKRVTPQGNVYTPDRTKSKSGVLYSDAVVGSDEYNAIKSSKDFARSYRDYANRKDLSEEQKEQRAVADIMAYYKQEGAKNE